MVLGRSNAKRQDKDTIWGLKRENEVGERVGRYTPFESLEEFSLHTL